MRKINLICVLSICVCVVGCGSEVGAGAAGVGLGSALQHTLSGAQRDLEAREAALIKAYNEGVAIGAKQEDLAAIEKELERLRRGQAVVKTGGQLLNTNWSNPRETGLAVTGIFELALLVFGGKKLASTTRKLRNTEEAVNKYCGISEPKEAGILHDIVKMKTVMNT
jgi:hypothetical protein